MMLTSGDVTRRVRSGELVVLKGWREEVVEWVNLCVREEEVTEFGCVGQNEGRKGWFGWSLVVFFGVAKYKKRNGVHRKRVARIKHRGGQGWNSDRKEKEKGIRYTKPGKILGEKSSRR